QHLKAMPMGFSHHVKNLLDKFEWDILMEKIAHRIDEYCAWLFPPERQFNHMLMQGKLETIGIIGLSHQFQPHRQPFRVAMLATGTNFCAAGNRIPSGAFAYCA